MIVKHNISEEDYLKLLKITKAFDTTVKDACRFMINCCLSDYYYKQTGLMDCGKIISITEANKNN